MNEQQLLEHRAELMDLYGRIARMIHAVDEAIDHQRVRERIGELIEDAKRHLERPS